MEWKWVVRYWIIFMAVTGLVLAGLKWKYSRSFSVKTLAEMTDAPAANKFPAADPCQFQTSGDPTEPNRLAVKLWLYCSGKKAENTFSMAAVDDRTAGGVIRLAAKINGFSLTGSDKWDCNVNGEKSSWSREIKAGNLIICYINN